MILDLQVALKCELGILYFQTQIPLYVLFIEHEPMAQNAWLKLWRGDIPSSNESSTTIFKTKSFPTTEAISHMLLTYNIHTIALRTVDEMVRTYSFNTA